MNVDHYVIRIYRRDHSDARRMVGIVENVDIKVRRGFTTFDELREILVSLCGSPSDIPRKKPRKRE